MAFKIADGYVEVFAKVDQRSVKIAAEEATAGVADQMDTGIAFSNLRRGGRTMGAVLGEHAGPRAAEHSTSGLAEWVAQGAAADNTRRAGQTLGENLGESTGETFARKIVEKIKTVFSRDVSSEIDNEAGSGGLAGDREKTRTTRITDRIVTKTDVDNSGREIGDRLGRATEKSFFSHMKSALTSGFGPNVAGLPIFSPVGIAIGGAILAGVAPVLSAGLSAAIIGAGGLGMLGLGAFLLKDNPLLKQAFAGFKTRFGDAFAGVADPLLMPFIKALEIFADLAEEVAPSFKEMFADLAPTVEPIARGIAGFIREALPGFQDIIKAAVPFLKDLENTLPRLGAQFGEFLTSISNAGPEATLFFRDLLHFIGWSLKMFGDFIEFSVQGYEILRGAVLFARDNFELFKDAVVDAWNVTVFVGKAAIEGWAFIWDQFTQMVTGGTDWIAQVPHKVKMAFVGLLAVGHDMVEGWQYIWDQVKKIIDSGTSKFTDIPNKAAAAAKKVPGAIVNALGDTTKILYNAGRNIIQGLINGITDMIGALKGKLGSITSLIPSLKGPEDRDRQLLVPAGQLIMQGLISGIDSQVDNLASRLGQLTSRMPVMAAAPALAGGAQGGGMSAGGITINVYALTPGDIPRATVAALNDALDRYRRGYK